MALPTNFRTPFDEYRAEGQIGQGNSGYVLAARNAAGELLALKILDPAKVTPQLRKRFQNEIRFGQRVGHPNVMSVLDVGEIDVDGRSTLFYVMPKFDMPLRRALANGIPAENVLSVFRGMLDGVETAHLNGVWHRDLKPENVLVSATLDRVVIGDFGIAHFSDSDLYEAARTEVFDRMANFRYCAPEQTDPKGVRDARADIYALGLMLNEMFTGEVARATGYTTIRTRSEAHGYLDDVVELMIQQDPARRLQTIDAVKQAISVRGREYMARQSLDAARQVVIPESEPKDPLIHNPITIRDFDWEGGRLTLVLSASPPPMWRELYMNRGYDSMLSGSTPRETTITGNKISVRADERSADKILAAYRKHIPKTNAFYEQAVRHEHANKLAQERHQAHLMAEAAAARQRVLDRLKS